MGHLVSSPCTQSNRMTIWNLSNIPTDTIGLARRLSDNFAACTAFECTWGGGIGISKMIPSWGIAL